jgi:hypothetical protein
MPKRDLRIADGAHDRVLRLGYAMPDACTVPVGFQKNSAVAHVVRGRVLQVFERQPVQVVRRAHQLRVERAQHAQHADRLFAARVEGRRSRPDASGEPARRLSRLKVCCRTVPNRWQCSSTLGMACRKASRALLAVAGVNVMNTV